MVSFGCHHDGGQDGPTPEKILPFTEPATRLTGTDVFRMLDGSQPQGEAVASGSGEVNPFNTLLSILPFILLRFSAPLAAPWIKRADLPTLLGKSQVRHRPPSPSQTFANLLPSSSASVSILFTRKMSILRLLLVPTRSQNQSPKVSHSCLFLSSDRNPR